MFLSQSKDGILGVNDKCHTDSPKVFGISLNAFCLLRLESLLSAIDYRICVLHQNVLIFWSPADCFTTFIISIIRSTACRLSQAWPSTL